MRNLWILLVLLVTALTFYSALRYKSVSIEEDITARVGAALDAEGAEAIERDVDGRHVTLSGIVHDEAEEARYLQLADDTYGALGPIDGLTYLADGGYITATKTDAGITLRGTVPNEELRAALIAEASEATQGEVTDALTLSGPVAPWQDEAAFGLSALAGLTSGTMSAAAGSYALSGNAASDAGEIEASLAGREGWTAFLSSPGQTAGLQGEVARLEGALAERDTRLSGQSEEIAGQKVEIDGLNARIAAQNTEIADLTAQSSKFEAELAARQSDLGASGDQLSELQSALDAAKAELGELEASSSGEITRLTGRVSDLETQLDLANASSDDQTRLLREQLAASDDKIAGLGEELNSLRAIKEGQIATLRAIVGDRDGALAGLEGDASAAQDRIAALQGEIADSEATNSALQDALSDRDDVIASLRADVTDREAQIATLSGAANAASSDADGLNAQIAALQETSAEQEAELSDLRANLGTLEGTLAERDATIAALQNQPATTAGLGADQCAGQAAAALEGSRINFVTASAEIEDGSVPLLERLTGIALACVSEEGVTVEIGGHTDAQGTEANNLALSEARAQAVVAFMTERGVPADGLRARGFGEGQPIASNDTAEGRAQNRRISFDWQAR